MAMKKQGNQKKAEQKQIQKKQKAQKKKFDHSTKAVEVRSAYKVSVEGKVKTGLLLHEYRCELADDMEFTAFWRDHLHWVKSTVYRLADVGKHFGTMPPDTLAWFDLSALYLLSGKRVQKATRRRAIKKAESGKFVSHADVKEWLGKKPANPANLPRPGTVRIDMAKLTAEAKKLKLNAGKVVELLERLGVGVDWLGEKPAEAAKSSKLPKREVA